MGNARKIINDPVYGFITIKHPLIFKIISHPYYQRLRRIHQMALAFLVYPGAVHTRLHHSLGAYHLICNAVNELKAKGTDISNEEEIAVKAAILLHDVGHGPFSHALEQQLIFNISHEETGLKIMQAMNEEFGGELTPAIQIFTNQYPKKFLHQLISGQLDVDRMDYLTLDSFFTGVSEGVIGYDRILKMLIEKDGELMVEEKGIYSIEKFLVARRQMYWQVYLHKTVVAAENMLVKIIQRVRYLLEQKNKNLEIDGSALNIFLQNPYIEFNNEVIDLFCRLDDNDIVFALKKWSFHSDTVLSELCKKLLNRKLLKIKIQSEPFSEKFIQEKLMQAAAQMQLPVEDAGYFVFTGEAKNTMYKKDDERINILLKDGTVKDISAIDNPLIHQTVSSPVKKFYICSLS
jgi:HD superfamily phosphohydrolase